MSSQPLSSLRDREILLGVTGGIAAYKAADLCSKCAQAGARVTVVMSAAAEQFVTATTFAALSGRPVVTDLFAEKAYPRGAHIELAERADVFVVAPATARFLAQAALGLADDLLATLTLCHTGPFLVAPAMNTDMWEKPAVQRNLAQLQSDGATIINPGSGWLSCGRIGVGRMAEPAEILGHLEQACAGLAGRTR